MNYYLSRLLSICATFTCASCAITSGISTSGSYEKSELHIAAESGNIEIINRWIATGNNLNLEYSNRGNMHEGMGMQGVTALMLAAEAGNLEAVMALVAGGANIYATTWRHTRKNSGYENSAFDYSIKGGDPKIVKYLWQVSDKNIFTNGIRNNLSNAYQRMCSHHVPKGAEELAIFLLDNLADDYLASENLKNLSAQPHCVNAIRFLLGRGVKPAPSALQYASAAGRTEIISLYLEFGADVNAYSKPQHGTAGSRTESIALTLACGPWINGSYNSCRSSRVSHILSWTTPLIAASAEGQLHAVELLLAAGADPNKADSLGRTALIAALTDGQCGNVQKCNRLEIVRILIKSGARPEIRDHNNYSAFDYANAYPADLLNDEMKNALENAMR